MNYEEILLNVILNKKKENFVGLIINRISIVDIEKEIELLSKNAKDNNHEYYVVLVDKAPIDNIYDNIHLEYSIEKAVEWRSKPEYANNIIVFLEAETEKMHSLEEFAIISQRDLSVFLIMDCIDKAPNEPIKKFWEALKEKISLFPFNVICDFFNNTDLSNQQDMLDNLWRLGLIKDKEFFSTNKSALDRLMKNQDVLQKMASLSDVNRRKINSALSKAKSNKDKLKETYDLINKYFRFHTSDILKQLDMTYVEQLLEASKEKVKPQKVNQNSVEPQKKDDEIIKSNDLIESFNEAFVESDNETIEDLKDNLESLRDYYDKTKKDDEDFDSSNPIELKNGEYENKLFIPKNNEELQKFVNKFLNQNIWGGKIITNETSINSILGDAEATIEYFDINDLNSSLSFNGKTIEKIFGDLDKDLLERYSVNADLLDTFKKIKLSRMDLLKNIDLIINYPTPLFSADKQAKSTLIDYVSSWQALYKALSENKAYIEDISRSTWKFITRFVLSVNNVFVVGQVEPQLKAVMLPLNPLYLWKYYEIFNNIADSERDEDDNKALVDSLNNLPNLITHLYVKLSDDSAGINVPYCGLVKNNLPYYEDNKLKGNDGIDNIYDILERWLGYAPYTKNELRIGMIDVPDILNCLSEISKFVDDKGSKIIIDFYFTDNENHYSELTYLADLDERVSELIESNRVVFHIYERQTNEDIKLKIEKHPLHILFFFDQCSYINDYGQSECQRTLSPLVPTYEYKYDKYLEYGDIFPSTNTDSGIIGAYHGFLKQNGFIDANKSPMTKLESKGDLAFANSALSDGLALWEVVADRIVYNYAPTNAICIGEKMLNKRNLCIYAHETSRVINDFEKLLRGYNLQPKTNVLVNILKNFAHISAEGLIAIPKNNSDSINNRRKGLIGTVFSAYFYKEILHKDSLVASLDSKEAGIWISNFENDNDRADLVGLWFDEKTETLNIDVLEVKTRDIDPDEEHATKQALKIKKILQTIFDSNQENIFSASRREVLKKQLINECFRGIHDPEWQLKWENIFRKVFTESPEYKVNINSYIYHIKLSVFDDGYKKYSDYDKNVMMYIITAKDIQDFLFDKQAFDESKYKFIQEEVVKDNSNYVEKINFDDPFDDDYILKTQVEKTDVNKVNEETSVEDFTQTNNKYSDNENEIKTLGKAFYDSCKNRKIKICSDFKNELNNVIVGSRVFRYYFRLESGSKLESLINQLDDIGREIKRSGLIVSNIQNDDRIILDIPRLHTDPVNFKSIISKLPKITSPEQLYFPIGREPDGNDVFKDLSEMPHMLIGGSTGSGKTVFLHSMICSLLMNHPTADDLKLIISSAGIEDFVYFEGLPHLINGKIITTAKETVNVIKTVVNDEFERRAKILSDVRAKNIIEYNQKSDIKLPPIVIIIDEFADIADQLSNKKEREEFYTIVRRIVQIGRKRGIHMVLCTQRPSANLVPTDIKAQLTARLALRVTDATSSRMIIDETGAQNLQKHGDLIFKSADGKIRAQGYNISTDEVDEIVSKLI